MDEKLLPHEALILEKNIDASKLFDAIGNKIESLNRAKTIAGKETDEAEIEINNSAIEDDSNEIVEMINKQIEEIGIEAMLKVVIATTKAGSKGKVDTTKEKPKAEKTPKADNPAKAKEFVMRGQNQLVAPAVLNRIMPRATHDDILGILYDEGYRKVSIEILDSIPNFNTSRPIAVNVIGAEYNIYRLRKHAHEPDYVLSKIADDKPKAPAKEKAEKKSAKK